MNKEAEDFTKSARVKRVRHRKEAAEGLENLSGMNFLRVRDHPLSFSSY